MRRRRVTVVEPVVGGGRSSFFERLGTELDRAGIDLAVASGAGAPGGSGAPREPVGGSGGSRGARRSPAFLGPGTGTPPDAWVLGQSLGAPRAYRLLLAPRGVPVAVWGRPGPPPPTGFTGFRESTGLAGAARLAALTGLAGLAALTGLRGTRGRTGKEGDGGKAEAGPPLLRRGPHLRAVHRADWLFTPTDAGARRAVERGFPEHRVTLVREVPDTASLAAARAAVPAERVRELRERHGLTPGRTALHLGPLDASQRLPFLLAAAELAGRRLPGFRLLVAGPGGPVGGGADGTPSSLVESAAEGSPSVVRHEAGTEEEKALLGAAADVLLVPGAVGPCVPDSFALGLPVVTVPLAGHGPEFEYLEHRRNALVVHGAAREFADAVVDVLASPERLAGLGAACLADASRYTVEGMSRCFAAGIEGLLIYGARRSGPWKAGPDM